MVRTVLCVAVALVIGYLVTYFTLSVGLMLAAVASAAHGQSREVMLDFGRIYAIVFYIIALRLLVAGRFPSLPVWVALSVFVAVPIVLVFGLEPQQETHTALYGLVLIAALPAYQLVRQLFFKRM